MGVISVSLPSDGSTADVADVNTPFTTIINTINGGLDTTNLADNAVSTAKIANNAVTSAKVNFGGSGVGIWWEEIGRATVITGTSTSISTGTLATRKHLMIIGTILPDAAITTAQIRFNNDTGTNYMFRLSSNNSADSTGSIGGIPVDSGSSAANPTKFTMDVLNISTVEKLVTGDIIDRGTAGMNAPNRRDGLGKWVNTTAQITTVQLTVTGCNLTVGSDLIVLGHD